MKVKEILEVTMNSKTGAGAVSNNDEVDYLSYVPVDLTPKIEAALNGNDEVDRVKEIAERLNR